MLATTIAKSAKRNAVSRPSRLTKSVKTAKPSQRCFSRSLQMRGHKSFEYHRDSTRWSTVDHKLIPKLENLPNPHLAPKGIIDKLAYNSVQMLRWASDLYFKDDLVLRATMLETVAAIPGMVGGMMHHLDALRNLEHNNWIKTLLDEAENERMHLMTWMAVQRPTFLQRCLIMAIQAGLFVAYGLFYIVSPKFCHRFVGYLEEEAVKTYTHFLEMIDSGKIKNGPAPKIALTYWGLPADATVRDVVVVVRADEVDHRDVNHTMANYIVDMKTQRAHFRELSITDDIYSDKIEK